MAHFASFLSLIETAILPLIQQHPTWARLDGKTSGGNRTPFATFEYVGKKWRLHSDSKIEPLLRAWNMEKEGRPGLVEVKTAEGRLCLRQAGSPGKAGGVYIYAL